MAFFNYPALQRSAEKLRKAGNGVLSVLERERLYYLVFKSKYSKRVFKGSSCGMS